MKEIRIYKELYHFIQPFIFKCPECDKISNGQIQNCDGDAWSEVEYLTCEFCKKTSKLNVYNYSSSEELTIK